MEQQPQYQTSHSCSLLNQSSNHITTIPNKHPTLTNIQPNNNNSNNNNSYNNTPYHPNITPSISSFSYPQGLLCSSQVFPAVYPSCSNCSRSFYTPYIIIPSHRLLKLTFTKTIIKEAHLSFPCSNDHSSQSLNRNNYKLEFVIEVHLNGTSWFIRRKLKDFIELSHIV